MFSHSKISSNNSDLFSGGFTLIELLVVIAIISLLSSVVLASLSGARKRAKVTRMASDLKEIEKAVMLWMDETGQVQFPPENSFNGNSNPPLNVLVNNSNLSEYINSVPDPQFGDVYTYDNDGDDFSCGGDEWAGVNIAIGSISSEDVQSDISEIIDGNDNLDCGKVKSSNDSNLFYSLSKDGNL